MESLYKNLNEKKFKNIAIFTAFVSDLVIAKYIWSTFTNKEVFEKSIDIAVNNMKQNQNFDQGMIPKDFFNELFQLWTVSLGIMLFAILLVHSINYLLYKKDKVFAFKYLRMQAWGGSIGLLLIGLPNLQSGSIYMLCAASGLGLLYTAFGLKKFIVKSPEPKS